MSNQECCALFGGHTLSCSYSKYTESGLLLDPRAPLSDLLLPINNMCIHVTDTHTLSIVTEYGTYFSSLGSGHFLTTGGGWWIWGGTKKIQTPLGGGGPKKFGPLLRGGPKKFHPFFVKKPARHYT